MKRFLILLIAATSSPFSLADSLTFGIVPQQSASRLAEQWTPLLNQLSEELGQKVVFTTAVDIPTFEQRLANGDYDFAYMNPYHYTVFSQSPGYQAIAKAKNKKIRGIIVVRKDSGIDSPNQLQGTTLAFPSPAAFAASVLTRDYLAQQHIDFTPAYVRSHDSVYLSVANGFYPAGGGVMRTFNSIPAELRAQLTPIWTTEAYTPHAIAAHPDLPQSTVDAFQRLLVKLDQTTDGKVQLKPLNIEGFEAASDSDWNDVRSLRIDVLENEE
ncbi:phosphate/phosphite/phosphonate ABC transporter substrate-binding protein [Vibrio proteolyticus]|uniref:Putative ABC transporter substrate-binding protein n=1 Tax=Vibrio proteolyticus NBRC 13287 TaxID=1219065 RepID=U2ZV92_VIBPR|nr:phosphate/phosphite/phosphonate ABC transporter substrate-binding protein [Vibrio proteolyticus]GAD65335.1 putative ABC transporter substrate-binding protein [Vibrio proteolyticus NBRC 13287]